MSSDDTYTGEQNSSEPFPGEPLDGYDPVQVPFAAAPDQIAAEDADSLAAQPQEYPPQANSTYPEQGYEEQPSAFAEEQRYSPGFGDNGAPEGSVETQQFEQAVYSEPSSVTALEDTPAVLHVDAQYEQAPQSDAGQQQQTISAPSSYASTEQYSAVATHAHDSRPPEPAAPVYTPPTMYLRTHDTDEPILFAFQT